MQKLLSPAFLVSIIASLVLCACGGGGGSSGGAIVGTTPIPDPGTPAVPATPPTAPPTTPPTTPPAPIAPVVPVQAVLNPTITGKLYFNGPTEYVEMDLASGVARVLRPRDSAFWTSRDATDFVTTNRFIEGDDPSSTDEELVFFDRDGLQKSRFLRTDGFGGRPEIAPSGQHVIVEWHSIDQGDAGGVSVPSIFLRSGGAPVKRYAGYGGYHWMSNGKILLSRGDSIFVVTATGTGELTQFSDPVLLKSFPNNTPFGLVSSPDSSKIAFSLPGAGVSENHVWIMNADGTNLKQLTTSNTNEEPSDFSPDGSQLMISQGIAFANIGPGFVVTGCPEAYVIPINLNAPLLISENIAAPGLKLKSYTKDGDVTARSCLFSRAQWRSAPSVTPTLGSAITGAGLNRGLSGKMLYSFAGDFFVTDLSTATVMPGNKVTRDVFASRDGTELIFSNRFAQGTGTDNTKVSIINPAGIELLSYFILDGFGNTLKFSPDKTRYAALWSNLDIGDAGGIPVVTIFDRAGNRIKRYRGWDGYDWAPNSMLYMKSLNELYRVDPTTNAQPALITRTASSIGDLSISPDGTQIAFTMKGNVWIMNIDGTALRKVTESNVLLAEVVWSPNGKVLAVTERDSPSRTWAVPADATRVALNTSVINTSAFQIKASPGQLIAVSSRISWR